MLPTTAAPSLELIDGSVFSVVAADTAAERIVTALTAAMALRPAPLRDRCVLVHSGAAPTTQADGHRTILCPIDPNPTRDQAPSLARVARAIARDAEDRGGVLLHGALATRGDAGIVLAGASGIGKTTATARLTPPWNSLSDDMTLIVPDERGDFWCHPWPTWSRFYEGGQGGAWNVARAARLHAICLLKQATRDRAEPLRGARAAVQLLENTRSTHVPDNGEDVHAVRADWLQRFARACSVAAAVPCFVLHITRDGAFWRELDRILDAGAQP
jgi:SynChlorMet cassette protein ScmC